MGINHKWGRGLLQKGSRKFVVVVAMVTAFAGGMATIGVMAAIPDSNKVIHTCYTASGAVRIIDSATANCTPLETALTWNQQGPVLKYASAPAEVSLTNAESVAANDLADLNGPQVTVTVPSTPGALVRLYLSTETKVPCDLAAQVFVVDEADGQKIDQTLAAGGNSNVPDFTLAQNGGEKSGQWRSIQAAPGTHTYGVRYAASDFGGADTTCSGSFRNTQLWAEVNVPS